MRSGLALVIGGTVTLALSIYGLTTCPAVPLFPGLLYLLSMYAGFMVVGVGVGHILWDLAHLSDR